MRFEHEDNVMVLGAYGKAGVRHMSLHDSQSGWSCFIRL